MAWLHEPRGVNTSPYRFPLAYLLNHVIELIVLPPLVRKFLDNHPFDPSKVAMSGPIDLTEKPVEIAQSEEVRKSHFFVVAKKFELTVPFRALSMICLKMPNLRLPFACH